MCLAIFGGSGPKGLCGCTSCCRPSLCNQEPVRNPRLALSASIFPGVMGALAYQHQAAPCPLVLLASNLETVFNQRLRDRLRHMALRTVKSCAYQLLGNRARIITQIRVVTFWYRCRKPLPLGAPHLRPVVTPLALVVLCGNWREPVYVMRYLRRGIQVGSR